MKNFIQVFGDDAMLRFWGEFAMWLVTVFAILAAGIALF